MNLSNLMPGESRKKLSRLLCVTALSTCSVFAYAQQQQVKLTGSNLPLKSVFKQIEKQTDLSIDYRSQDVDDSRIVKQMPKATTVQQAMNQLLAGTDCVVTFSNGHIIIKKQASNTTNQQSKLVKGIIVDATGMPVIGANVMVKGTTNGTITDLDGRFTLDVPQDAVLEVSYIGYSTQTIKVGGQKSLSIMLKEDTQALDEVVVVGYGTQKKVNLTGSVSSVKFDEELANRPITDASQALSGKVSGVWISQNSGKPGDDGAQLRIRGWGTLNNTDPLVIIDGVEGSFSQINPSDIESISVLKDAASAAIYGSKAANGVVLVTTKMGKNNEKTQVELNSYVGFQQLGRHYDLVTNSAEHMAMANLAMKNNGASPLFPESVISGFTNGNDPYKYPNTDWYDELFRNALITGHNLSIRGGSEKLSAFTSLNYLKQDGIIEGTDAQRFGIRSNLDYKVNTWFRIGGRMNYIRKEAQEPFSLSNVYTQLCGVTPFIAPYTEDGRFGSVQALGEDGTMLYSLYNPLIHAANGASKTTTDYLSINAYAVVDFSKDLNLQLTWASNGNWKGNDKHNQTIYGYTDTGIEMQTKAFNKDGILMSRNQISSFRNNFHATLNFNKKIKEVHNLSSVLGFQLEDYQEKNVFARRTNPPKEGMTQVDAGTEGMQAEGNLLRLRMVSYFGRLNYSFADRYLFEMNLRADASSRFKRGNRWGFFPGFSAGWRLSEEQFVKNLDFFSNLKLRTSWGQLGNQTISGYWPYLTVINQSYNLSYNYGGAFYPGAAVVDLVDEDITWETTSSLDIGLDIGMFDNRLNIEADYFNKITKDILVQLPIAQVLGQKTAPFENLGEMKNDGFELVINYDNQENDRNRLGYNIGLNLTWINNKVTKFQGGKSPDQLYLIREGYSYKSLYGYKAIGIYQTDDEAREHMHSNGFVPKQGNLKYEDVNGDGKLDYHDKQVLGNTIPKLTYGITAGLRYKGFDLNLLFQGIGNANVMIKDDMTKMSYEWMTIPSFWKDAWSPENTNTNIPMLRFDSSWDNYDSSFWTHRIDFLKLKNLQIGYSFPEEIVSKLRLSRLYLYANAQNLFTLMWYNGYEGYDPERDTFGSGSSLYPASRAFTFGLNINF